MDILKHNEILLKWIKSCQTAQQLDLFTKLVTEFDALQYHNEINLYEMELIKTDLLEAILERRVTIAGKKTPMILTAHHLLIPNESAVYLSK